MHRAAPGSASPGPEGTSKSRSQPRGGVGGGVPREAPRMHPRSVGILLHRGPTCAALPESGRVPASCHECRPHVGRGQPGCPGACRLGTRAQRPGSVRGRNAGRESVRSVTGRSRQLQPPAPAPCPWHSPAPSPTDPEGPHGKAPPRGTAGGYSAAPSAGGDAAPPQGCIKGQRLWRISVGEIHKGGDQRRCCAHGQPWQRSQPPPPIHSPLPPTTTTTTHGAGAAAPGHGSG